MQCFYVGSLVCCFDGRITWVLGSMVVGEEVRVEPFISITTLNMFLCRH
jgi:hypothetical protein